MTSHHADSLAIPSHIITKSEFYSHLISTLILLLSPSPPPTIDNIKRNWITLLSNASALISGSFENFTWGKEAGKRVNWTGFYLHPSLFSPPFDHSITPEFLLLGPFLGRPACLEVSLLGKRIGVCASSYLEKQTILVPNVEERPGHIACDGVTQSEIVIPIIVKRDGKDLVLGVLDVDCEAKNGFDQEDVKGLEAVVRELIKLLDWNL